MVELNAKGVIMKKFISLFLGILLIFALMFTACSDVTDGPSDSPVSSSSPSNTSEPAQSAQPTADNQQTPAPSTSQTPQTTPEATPEPTPEPGPVKVYLENSPDSTGNSHFASSHYGLNISYTGEYITLMNYMTMFLHGDDIYNVPEKIEGFELQAEDLQFHNGLLYFLNYDWDNGVYYLYSYDFENEPAKVTDSTVYHYEFINGTIYFTKEFVQGPIYSMSSDGSGEKQLTTMRAHSFVNDGQALYFYATDAGTAPGLVKYDLGTNEETTVVFPFYSHNYMVHGGYVYYVLDTGTYRSIHRMSLSDQSVEDIWLEMTDYSISLNISDGNLFILAGDGVYKGKLNGSDRVKILEANDYLQSGLYIFGNRIYCTDGGFVYCTLADGSEVSVISFSLLQ